MVTGGARRSASDELFYRLRDCIHRGEYAVGERMPTEQALCASLKVGRSTVREAMRSLQAEGYVSIRRGSGAYVVSQTGNRGEFISRWIGENREGMTDYMVVRMDVECLAARLFIRSFDADTMERLAARERAFEEELRSGDTYRIALADESLHSLLIEASKNRFLRVIGEQLTEAFREYRYVAFEQKDFFDGAVREHRRILDALSRRDTDEALYSIRLHLDGSLKHTFGVFDDAPNSYQNTPTE